MKYMYSQFWVTRLRAAGVSENTIQRLYKKYGSTIPTSVIDALIDDRPDVRCGIGAINLGKRESCAEHDEEVLLDKLGYPITNIAETALKFLGSTIIGGVIGAYVAVSALPYAVVGASGGAAIMIYRKLKKQKT